MDKFKLIKSEYIDELKGEAELYEHIKTKASVLKIKNSDENKAFGIGFRTVQNDDTGVCHILEHSVLSGSRKFKTKEPFMDLVKTSLQTFVNAMTFDDKTIFPISSRNEKDFFNLMDVYMDAVLHPDFYNNEKIFMQEGWHYEIENKDDPITVTGIVYNEMKGAMSPDIMQVMEDKIPRYLYKGSTYSTNSGGDPEAIPNLTYEDLINYHKEKYHPSNSYIFLYGNGDTEKELEFLDGYLCEFDYKEIKDEMRDIQPLKEEVAVNETYFGEEKENSDFVVVGYVTGDSTDNLNNIINEVLLRALLTEEGASIKDRILSENLATDVETVWNVGKRNTFCVIAKGSDEKHKNDIVKIIDEEIAKIAENGLDEKVLKALLHQIKYDFISFNDTPLMGIYCFIRATGYWNYKLNPIDSFKFNEAFKTLEENPDLIKEYVKKYMGKNRLIMLVKADASIGPKRDEELRKKLEEFKKSLSEPEIEELIKKTKDLHEFQIAEDSYEAKNTIPKLSVKDLSEKLEAPSETIDGNISYSERFTAGVTYLNAVLPIEDLDNEDIMSLKMVTDLIDKLDTKSTNYHDLQMDINMLAYDFNTNISANKFYGKNEAMLSIKKVLSADANDFSKAYELFNDVQLNTDFSNVKRIKEVLNARVAALKVRAIQGGIDITKAAAMKDLNRLFEIYELLNGYSYIAYLEETAALEDGALTKYLQDKYEIYKKLYKENGYYHITSDKAGIKTALEVLKADGVHTERVDNHSFKFKNKPGKTVAIAAVTDVNYCVDAVILDGVKGSDKIARNMISNNYLHDNIRAKGGAYGDGIDQAEDTAYFYSFRDPNLENTFKVYEKAAKWLKEKEISQSEIDLLIIGSYNYFDANLTPRLRSVRDFYERIVGYTHADREKALKEALNTTRADFVNYADRLEKAMENKGRAVLTNKEGLERTKDMWEYTYKIN